MIWPWQYEKLFRDLESEKKWVRHEAAKRLGQSRNRRGLDPLRDYLKKSWSMDDIRDAVRAIYDIGGLDAILPVLENRQQRHNVISYVAFTIGRCGADDPRSFEVLLGLLDQHRISDSTAADAFALLGDTRATPRLLELYNSVHPTDEISPGVKTTSRGLVDVKQAIGHALEKLGHRW